MIRQLVLAVACILALLASSHAQGDDRANRTWQAVVDDAVKFLRKAQAPDGSFSGDRHIGITGLVVAGLLESGAVDRDDPLITKGLGFIEKQINKQEGHIAGQNAKIGQRNYTTAVNVLALAKANNKGQYDAVLKDTIKFLKGLQWDEGQGIDAKDPRYGGFGYDAKSRPDVSNTQFALDALRAAGLKTDDEAFKKAAVFISRSQNLKSEYQDQPWADKINDGSFIYNPPAAKPGETAAPMPGYASMTYAGIKSLIYAGVDKNDFRVQNALKWIRAHYSMEENVGQPKEKSQSGLYYYYHTLAKCMDALGIEEFVDAQGGKHKWRQDLLQTLAKRQRPDGSWVNPQDRFMEGDPSLVTGFALMTLSYCKPK